MRSQAVHRIQDPPAGSPPGDEMENEREGHCNMAPEAQAQDIAADGAARPLPHPPPARRARPLPHHSCHRVA
jgi:hypothetical protein